MTYTYKATNDGLCEIYLDGKKIDTVGPWETKAEADNWGSMAITTWNSPEYANYPYPKHPPITEE